MADVAVVIRNNQPIIDVFARVVDEPILLGPSNALHIPVTSFRPERHLQPAAPTKRVPPDLAVQTPAFGVHRPFPGGLARGMKQLWSHDRFRSWLLAFPPFKKIRYHLRSPAWLADGHAPAGDGGVNLRGVIKNACLVVQIHDLR